jgi:NitT/TauT family transport system substrate-binding protein
VATVPAVTNMGLFLAKEFGFFTAAGLDVTIESIQSSTVAVAEQLRGGIDVTAGAYVSYILAQAHNAGAISWRILAEGSVSRPRSQQILVAANSTIRAVADLKGKTVAANILDNVGTLLTQSALASHGVPLSAVKLVAVPFPSMASALAKGDIDAGWFDEPFLSAAKHGIGARELFDTCQGATTGFPISGYMATNAWAKRYPRTAAAFTRAISKGQSLANASRSDDERAAPTYIKGIPPKVATSITFDSYPASVDTARLQGVANTMQRFGLLGQRFDMSAMTA